MRGEKVLCPLQKSVSRGQYMAGKIPSLKETQVSSIAKIIIRKVSAVVDRCIVIAEKVYVLLSAIE